MSQLVQKLSPYFSSLVVVQMVLICVTLLIGIYMILKRFLGKDATAASNMDGEQIAYEITEEMMRLAQLRSKIFPSAGKVPADFHTQNMHAAVPVSALANASSPAVDGAQLAAFQAQMQAYEIKIKQLESEASANQQALAQAQSAATQSGGSVDPSKIQAEVDRIVNPLNKEKEDLSHKLAHLEKVVSEYRIFEEDFALVKKYKSENEKLKAQLANVSVGGGENINAPVQQGAGVSTSDIDKLFESASSAPVTETKVDSSNFLSADMFSSNDAPSSPAPVSFAAAAPSPPSAFDGGGAMDQSAIDALMGGLAASPPPTVAPQHAREVPTAELPPPQSTAATEEELEALAESSVNDDSLIQEFEKILGNKTT